MKKAFLLFGLALIVLVAPGCGRGPLRQFLRGSACSSCQPPIGRSWGIRNNTLGTCENGVCTGEHGDGAAVGSGSMDAGYYPGGTVNNGLQPGTSEVITENYPNGSLGTVINPPSSGSLPHPNGNGRNQ